MCGYILILTHCPFELLGRLDVYGIKIEESEKWYTMTHQPERTTYVVGQLAVALVATCCSWQPADSEKSLFLIDLELLPHSQPTSPVWQFDSESN